MTWLLVFQCWSLTGCPDLFMPLCRAIRNWLQNTRSHFTLWPRLDSRHRETEKMWLSCISSPKPKIHVTSRKRRNHNWGQNRPTGHQPGREAPVEVKHNLSFQVDVKFLPNKQQEGLANTSILKVNINLTSLVTGKLVLLSRFFFPSLPYSFSSEGEEINPRVRNRCSCVWAQMVRRRIWNHASGGYPPSHLQSKRRSKGTEVHSYHLPWRRRRCVFHQTKAASKTKEEAIQGNWG